MEPADDSADNLIFCHKIFRNDSVMYDFPITVNVIQKEIQRINSLNQPFLQTQEILVGKSPVESRQTGKAVHEIRHFCRFQI